MRLVCLRSQNWQGLLIGRLRQFFDFRPLVPCGPESRLILPLSKTVKVEVPQMVIPDRLRPEGNCGVTATVPASCPAAGSLRPEGNCGYTTSVVSFSPAIHTSPFCSGPLSQRLNSRSASRWAWPSSTTSRATATDLPHLISASPATRGA